MSRSRVDYMPISVGQFVPDSPLEGNGFKLPVPRQIANGFFRDGSIDRMRGSVTRAAATPPSLGTEAGRARVRARCSG